MLQMTLMALSDEMAIIVNDPQCCELEEAIKGSLQFAMLGRPCVNMW